MGVYSRLVRPRLHAVSLNDRMTGEVRHRVCAGLAGDVLEIGYGAGLNMPHLPATVTGIWAIEPSATALRLGEERRAASPVPVVLAGDDAQSLPFPDHRFDAALCTWVLCGIPDPGKALAEVARVLKPGGSLHFVEHGRAPDPGVVRWQRRMNPVNRVLAGCVLDNDVRAELDDSPLKVTTLETRYEEGTPRPFGFLYEGRATPESPVRVGRSPGRLPTGTGRSDVQSMTTSASPTWLPALIARAAVVNPALTRPSGRHLAPELPGSVRIAAAEDLTRRGRHGEPEWSRELHDPRRDEIDVLDWLGFAE